MAKRVRYLAQIVPHLEERYGTAKAQVIMQRALARYDALLAENANEPRECHMHTRERIYSAIATFDAMTAEGIERAEAADFLTGYYTWRAGGMARKIKALLRVPALYRVVPRFFYSMTERSFGPKVGFAAENKRLAADEMRFDMVRCLHGRVCAVRLPRDRAGLLRRRRRVLCEHASQGLVGAHQDLGLRPRPLRLQGPHHARVGQRAQRVKRGFPLLTSLRQSASTVVVLGKWKPRPRYLASSRTIGVTMEYDELSQELKDKARSCKTPEEVLALAQEEGMTLSDEELDQIAGGKGKWAHEECNDFIRQGKPRKK